jgi:cyclopropane-fatty-acyl-phospholipid synthase
MDEAAKLGFNNLKVITCDMNRFEIDESFDRIVSVEMFEHMRNYQVLFAKLDSWLKPNGKFMMHIFCHRDVPYAFDVKAEDDWMSQFFFSGGFMPSDDTPLQFQDDLKISKQWRWSGEHYEKTANAWLENMDKNVASVKKIFEECYGKEDAPLWIQRWRIFFMACAELFGFNHGQEWWVSHYLFEKQKH